MISSLDATKHSNFVVLLVVYLSFLIDNVLLTVVVPIIPDYLFSSDINTSSFNYHLGIKSLSPLQRKFENLEKDNGPLGALLASKAFVQLAFTPFIGHLTATVGFNLPLLLGSCNMLFAALLFAYGHTYGILVIARALHGSASAAISVSGMSLLAQTVNKETRSKFMPLAFGGIALGVLVGYPFGGITYQYLGKTAPFLLIAFFIVLNIGLQVWCLKPEDDLARQAPVNCGNWISLLQDKQTIIATTAICVCTSSMAILEPCLPLWLLANFNPQPSRWQLGAVFIPDSIGYFIGSHFTGLLPFQSWRVSLAAMVVTGLSCCAIPLATSIRHLTLPHFGLGLGVGAVDAALVPMLANFVDNRGESYYGLVYALQQTSVNLAYSLGPLLGGLAVHSIGFAWLMRIVGLLNVLYCPLMLELEKQKITIEPDKYRKISTALLDDKNSPPSYSSTDTNSVTTSFNKNLKRNY
ncbi:hypothetical protein RN001_012757 [Aquatica leii]|uniref:Major facilitator superfamily (MFS) profile domain-containing protein n=1 Tax=Aquatica leii TaxID=1421715 RepID=A0AAN7Q1X8_9COLE|nr:hypothetical protein RN001_012757 [Aquatica leii]